MPLSISLLIVILYTLECACDKVPVIGILSVPCIPEISATDCPSWIGFNATSYIPSSYVKFLESGGAKVVPILSTDTLQNISTLVLQLNGVLFTGGTEYFNSTSIYYNQVQNILYTLREFNTRQPYKRIPLWATCLGFQALVCATSKTGPSILQNGFDDYNEAHSVTFTSYAAGSTIFNSTMPTSYSDAVYNKMSSLNVTWYDHGSGFDPIAFVDDEYLNGNFSIIGNAFAPQSRKQFVALIEDKVNLSWFGAQFHPEKPQYEFAKDGVHDLDAIVVNQYLAQFFVNECRIRNDNEMDEDILDEIVIYNDIAYFVDKYGKASFEQNYLFN